MPGGASASKPWTPQAACRTYNILAGEGRNVVVAACCWKTARHEGWPDSLSGFRVKYTVALPGSISSTSTVDAFSNPDTTCHARYKFIMAIVVNKPLPEFEAIATGGVKVTNTSHLGKPWCCTFTPRTTRRAAPPKPCSFATSTRIS
jgi:hypothetical protein